MKRRERRTTLRVLRRRHRGRRGGDRKGRKGKEMKRTAKEGQAGKGSGRGKRVLPALGCLVAGCAAKMAAGLADSGGCVRGAQPVLAQPQRCSGVRNGRGAGRTESGASRNGGLQNDTRSPWVLAAAARRSGQQRVLHETARLVARYAAAARGRAWPRRPA
jgi:hypothetical protein